MKPIAHIAGFALGLLPAAAFAAQEVDIEPSHYIVTVKKIELCGNGSSVGGGVVPVCANSYLLGSGTRTFDIAASADHSDIGNYLTISPSNWPAGVTYSYMRVTLSRAHSITAWTSPASQGNTLTNGCATGGSDATGSTLAAGHDGNLASATATTIWEQDPTSDFGGGQADIYNSGQDFQGADYTQMLAISPAYTSTARPPTIRISFNMATAVEASLHASCSAISAGSNCCYATGPVTVNIALQ